MKKTKSLLNKLLSDVSPAQTWGYCMALQISGCSFLAGGKNTEAGPAILCPLSNQASPLSLRHRAWRGQGGHCEAVWREPSTVTLLTQPPWSAPWGAASQEGLRPPSGVTARWPLGPEFLDLAFGLMARSKETLSREAS